MIYKTCAHYSRAACHWVVDHTIPINSDIAIASGAVSAYVWNYGSAHFPEATNRWVEGWTCNRAVHFVIGDWCKTTAHYITIPFFTPMVVPKLSHTWSVGAGIATSFILNIIAECFFGPKLTKKTPPLQITDAASQPQLIKLAGEKRLKDNTPPPLIALSVAKYLKEDKDLKSNEIAKVQEAAADKTTATEIAVANETAAAAIETTTAAIETTTAANEIAAAAIETAVVKPENPTIMKAKEEPTPKTVVHLAKVQPDLMTCDCLWKFCNLPLRA